MSESDEEYDDFVDAVRELIDATARTDFGEAPISELTSRVRQVSRVLLEAAPSLAEHSERRASWHGNPANPVDGRQNAFALPLHLQREADRVHADFTLGAVYEGPTNHSHGGVVAMLLDQVMSQVPEIVAIPRMTAYLHVNYRRPTPLRSDLRIEAWFDRSEGRKRYVKGRIYDADGTTADAEALFVTLAN